MATHTILSNDSDGLNYQVVTLQASGFNLSLADIEDLLDFFQNKGVLQGTSISYRYVPDYTEISLV